MDATKQQAVRKRLPIAQIARDQAFQMRTEVNPKTVKRYEGVFKSGKEMPPVRVALVDDVPILVDGWHRMEALENLGHTEVEAEVIKATRDEALWMAGKANMEHGLPLKPKEMREAFRAFIRAKQHQKPRGQFKSYREMAAELGKPVGTIHNWMKKDFPRIAAKLGGNEDFKGEGGLPDAPPVAPQLAAAGRALDELVAAFQSTSNPEVRGRIIGWVEERLQEIKGSGSWEIEDTDF